MDMLRAYVEMRPLADNSFPLQTKIDQFSDTANETVDASEAYILGSHDGAVRSDSDNKPRGQHELDPVSIQQVSVRTREHVGKNGNIILDLPELIERGIPLPISDISALGSKAIDAPSVYMQSLPSKGVRSNIIGAFNKWLNLPEESTMIVKRIIDLLHESSLMLDDIQDSSSLRRGMPATHTIFGLGQTINSASYKIIQAMNEVAKLDSMDCMQILLDELRILYIGQSFDLYWSSNLVCPSIGEYFKSIDETGGLFRLLLRLMEAISLSTNKPNLSHLMVLLGRHFGIRDDYQNLKSKDYSRQKGFCEDLDEGKYSLPLIHALHTLPEHQGLVLQNVLAQRRANGHSSLEHKQLVLQLLEQSDSLNYTLAVLRLLQVEIDKEVEAIEHAGLPNQALRELLSKLYL